MDKSLHHKPSNSSHDSNAFDTIRHLAALSVLISHHFALSGYEEPTFFGITKIGTLAVIIFFSISGYLITGSYIKSKSTTDYIKKRSQRILPGLIVCSFIMTYIICGLYGKLKWSEYALSYLSFSNFVHFSFLGSSATAEQINNFSADYIFKNALNGSLWTLGFEVLDYLLIMIFINNKRSPFKGLTFLLVGTVATQVCVQNGMVSNYYLDKLSLFTIPFAIGGLLSITQEKWKKTNLTYLILIIGILLGAISSIDKKYIIIFYLSAPLIVIMLGTSFKDRLIKGRYDISYGIYIYAFPVQQVIINTTHFGFIASMILSALITIVLASLSWICVEKHFLKRTRK